MATYYIKGDLTYNGNNYGFSGTDVTIELDVMTKTTERIARVFAGKIEIPKSIDKKNDYAVSTIIIDLKQMRHFFDLVGKLTNDTGSNITNLYSGAAGSTPVSATAINKKNALIALAEQGGAVSFYHKNFGGDRPTGSGDNNSWPMNVNADCENVFINTMQFEDTETETGTDDALMKDNEERLGFRITFRKGVSR